MFAADAGGYGESNLTHCNQKELAFKTTELNRIGWAAVVHRRLCYRGWVSQGNLLLTPTRSVRRAAASFKSCYRKLETGAILCESYGKKM